MIPEPNPRDEHKLNHRVGETKISRELADLINRAKARMEEGGYLEITMPNFLRQALRYYSELVLSGGVGLAFHDPNSNGETNKKKS